MVDIYCSGGAFLAVDMEYNILVEIMQNNIIKPNDFIPVRFANGDKGAIRKSSINGFCEYHEEV